MSDRARENPFPGLRPFMQEEADLFFGRERQSDELVRRLASSRFLAVVGTSGSGKSSLVRAGLIPSLEGGLMADAGSNWRIAVMRPQDDPIGFLAQSIVETGLLKKLDIDPTAIESVIATTLRRSSLGLVDTVRLARLESHENLLIVVDQFEELFRFADIAKSRGAGEDAAAFVKLLLTAAQQNEVPVYVVITMRSDFLGDCSRFRGLPEAISDGQYLIPRLTRDELQSAIVGPVGVRGGRIAPTLVQHLLNAVGDDMDQLPVLQHALMRAWDHWEHDNRDGRAIDLRDLEAIGGLDGALSRHADEAFASLATDRERTLAERAFRCLCDKGLDNRETRRPTPLSVIAAIACCPPAEVVPVVDAFRAPGCSFLMPPAAVAITAETVIDISHESLIRQWNRLHTWVAAEAESRAMYLRLVEAARLHRAGNAGLWGKVEIGFARQWKAHQAPNRRWADRYSPGFDDALAFLDESARGLRQARLRKAMQFGAAVVLALAIGGPAVYMPLKAEEDRKAVATRLAASAQSNIFQDPARSALLAVAAIDRDRENPSAQQALRRSLSLLETVHAEHIIDFADPVADAHFTSDKSRLVVAYGTRVSIVDPETLQVLSSYAADDNVFKASLVGANDLLVVQSFDGSIRLRPLAAGTPTAIACDGDRNLPSVFTVNADQTRLAVGCRNGDVALWDVADGRAQRRPLLAGGSGHMVTAIAFSSDSNYLAAGDTAGDVKLWSVGAEGAMERLKSPVSSASHRKTITDIAFDPYDSRRLATASDDSTVIVVSLDDDPKARDVSHTAANAPKKRFQLPHERPVVTVRFTPRERDNFNSELMMTVSDKQVRFWENGKGLTDARGHNDWVVDANASEDGEYVASASDDGTARVWSTRSGAPIAILWGHRSRVTRAFFGSGNSEIFTASRDGTLRKWVLQPPKLIANERKWMLSAAYDSSGQRIAMCGEKLHTSWHCRVIDRRGATRHSAESHKDFDPAPDADAVSNISWSSDGTYLAGVQTTESLSSVVRPVVWDASTGKLFPMTWLQEWRLAEFGPSTQELVTVNEAGEVAVWDATKLPAGIEKVRFPAHAGRWWASLSSPDGRWIAAIDGVENRIALLDRLAPQAEPRTLRHASDIKSARFSRDGKWLVSASADGTARVWRVDTPAEESAPPIALPGNTALSWATFSPDAHRVITGSSDHRIRVWAWETHPPELLAMLPWHGEVVNDVEFSPNGKFILSASDDGTVKEGECTVCDLRFSADELWGRVAESVVMPLDEIGQIAKQAQVPEASAKLRTLFEGLEHGASDERRLGATRPFAVGTLRGANH